MADGSRQCRPGHYRCGVVKLTDLTRGGALIAPFTRGEKGPLLRTRFGPQRFDMAYTDYHYRHYEVDAGIVVGFFGETVNAIY